VVINMDLPWNPAVLEQRIGRVHRMGQARGVQVINFIGQGSIEEGILSLLAFKTSLFAGVLDGGTSEIFMQGTKLSQFMKSVEEVAGAMGEAEADEPAAAAAAGATAEAPTAARDGEAAAAARDGTRPAAAAGFGVSGLRRASGSACLLAQPAAVSADRRRRPLAAILEPAPRCCRPASARSERRRRRSPSSPTSSAAGRRACRCPSRRCAAAGQA
jgi:superfamily II DNA/RNA helicase